MRASKVCATALVGLVFGSSAFAAGTSEKGKGSGSSASSGGGGGAEGGGPAEHTTEDTKNIGLKEETQEWQVNASVEYHRLVRQNDLGGDQGSTGDAANKNVIYYGIGGQWAPTEFDRVVVRWGVYQRFLADPTETGVRSDDGVVAYTRIVPLPWDVEMRIQPRVDLGLSYESIQLSGLIAAPRLGVSVERTFGPVTVYALGYGYLYLEKYNEYAGGAANPKSSLHAILEVTATPPFLKELTLGVSGSAGATWYHEVQNNTPLPTTPDTLVPNQPFTNAFGMEVFARYNLPSLSGVDRLKWDATLAFANGDPTLGYQNLLHDGVGRFNLFYRHVAEVYGALAARY
jgi:hypothetical protein